MAFSMLLAAALGAQVEPPAPPSRFIVCPGNPRCPRNIRGREREEGRIEARRGFMLARPEPRPPADPAAAGDRTVYFAVNATALDDRARTILNALAGWLAANPSRSATIEGHADARGGRDQNIALAGRRAEAVRDYLVARGVPPGRLLAISFGEGQPALYDYGEPVWMMNRRVEIRIRR